MWIEHQVYDENSCFTERFIHNQTNNDKDQIKYDGYFDCLNAINNDLKRYKYIINTFKNSNDKDVLLNKIDSLIISLSNTIKDNGNNSRLEFIINNDYVLFQYWDYNEEEDLIYDVPSLCIIKRNYKKLYFIREMYEDFRIYEINPNISDDWAFGNHLYEFYNIENNEVHHYYFETIEESYKMNNFLCLGTSITEKDIKEFVEDKFKIKAKIKY